MPDLLVIGSYLPRMTQALEDHFTLWPFDSVDLDKDGARFSYLVTNGGAGISTADMAKLPNLRIISSYGVGYDAIDATEAARRGIVVTHTPDVLNAEVATTAILLMMACYRELLRDDAWLRDGKWESEGDTPLTRSVDGQKIGIVGMGRIGQEIARKLSVFDPLIHYHARSARDVPYAYEPKLVEMAAKVDCLIVITPGGPETRNLVNRDVIEALGPQGTLINVARGSVVDEAALIDCLTTGKLGWAGLDVFQNEPHVPEALRALPNTVLLPHVGSATHETRAAMGQLVVDNLLDFLKEGTARTPVPECQHLLR